MIRRALVAALLLAALPSAHAKDLEVFVTPDPAQPAVGEWIGSVSWNDMVAYSWTIYPDGTFSSARLGRAHGGADGAWTMDGARLTLKYVNGFRYEGELRGDAYSGATYTAEHRAFGTFSMSRAQKSTATEENS